MTADDPGSTPRPTTMLPQASVIGTVSSGRVAGDRWYVAYTQSRAESRAVVHLERQGCIVFWPRYRKTVRHARRKKSVLAPLFPNYLFLRLDASRNLWRAVNGTRSVVGLISQGETPQPLPHGVIEDLIERTIAGGVFDWTPTFKIGQAVRIANGPFADLVGKLEHLDAAGRVRVLLGMLGQAVSVTLRCEALIAAA